MILFGWRQSVKELGALYLQCRACGMPGWQHIYRKISWFTLFFVPVLPLRVSRLMVCGTCGTKTKLSKTEADRLVAQAPAPRHR